MTLTKNPLRVAVIILACFLVKPSLSQELTKTGTVKISSATTLVLDPNASIALRHAAEDLASDLKKVFGKEIRIVGQIAEGGASVILIKPWDQDVLGAMPPESFSITAGHRTIGGEAKDIVELGGADLRGTMFAVYQFAEAYLGVDPMYYWTDQTPIKRTEILLPATLSQKFDAPVFRYRGFFINDEDLLTGWAPGDKDHTGISLEVWNKIFETLLRLKANMVVPGSWIFPNEPQTRLAAERGLVLSIHHATPLGVNMARWPQDAPYNYSANPDILERAWTNAVNAYPRDQEILWEVGMRGLSDESYSELDPAVRNNDQAAGALISKAVAKQVSIVQAIHPDARFVSNLWAEGQALADKGFMQMPETVTTIWPDNGWGWLQDHGRVKAGQGLYYHVAMMNHETNQLTEMVPVERIFAELGRFQKAGATEFLLLNTSDIRPVAMTAKAVMNFGWSGGALGSSEDYYRRWGQNEFGAAVAADMADLFKAYFTAPAHVIPAAIPAAFRSWGANTMVSSPTGPEYGDMIYHTHAREMLLSEILKRPLFVMTGQAPLWRPSRIMRQGQEKEWVHVTIPLDNAATKDAAPRWDLVWHQAQALLPKVPPARRDYFRAEILTMIEINRESNLMLLAVTEAAQALENDDKVTAKLWLIRARHALTQIKTAEHWAEYGKWKDWYAGDWFTNVDRTAELVDIALRWVSKPNAPIPVGVRWNDWEAYFHIMAYEGDRSVDLSVPPSE